MIDPALLDELCRRAASVPGDVHEVVHAAHYLRSHRCRRAHRPARSGGGRPARRGSGPSRHCSTTPTSTRCWSTAAATSGSIAAALRPCGAARSARRSPVLERVLAPLGRRLDRSSPIVDARLPMGPGCAPSSDPSRSTVRRCRSGAPRRARCQSRFAGADVARCSPRSRAHAATSSSWARRHRARRPCSVRCSASSPPTNGSCSSRTPPSWPTVPHLVRLEARPAPPTACGRSRSTPGSHCAASPARSPLVGEVRGTRSRASCRR